MGRKLYDMAEIPFDADEDEGDHLTDEELDRALVAHQNGIQRLAARPAFASDPSQLGWPPTLPLELALHTGTPKEICESYGISREAFQELSKNEVFVADVKRCMDELKVRGASFKARAELQSVEYLKEAWRLVHSKDTPANVKAQLILKTIQVAGLDASKDQGAGKSSGGVFSINLNLG